MSTIKRPLLFGLKTKEKNYKTETFLELQEATTNYKELDLHKVLVKYLDADPHFKCLTKTIRHQATNSGEKSKNRKANEWVYPDLIGLYLPFNDFVEDTLKALDNLKETTYKIFSFEMKIKLAWSNYKEYYFQAVSNSSWANEGYLVCKEYEEDLYDELQILNSAFGIGIIVLDIKNPAESEIVFSAKQRRIDTYMLNKLIRQNKDVDIVFTYMNDCQNLRKDVERRSDFDDVLNEAEYSKYIKEKFGEE